MSEVTASTTPLTDAKNEVAFTNDTTATTSQSQQQQQVDITEVPVTNENVALNVMVAYLNAAQRRGAFNLKESAKNQIQKKNLRDLKN